MNSIAPFISVVIVVYNGEKYIKEAINSVVNQDYKNFELIIIDGGSNDKTIAIIKEFKDSITYWISEPDEGQSDALNKGFAEARGDIFCWLNADDYLSTNAFLEFVSFFRHHPSFDYYYSNFNWVDAKGNHIKLVRPYKRYMRLLIVLYGCYIPTSGAFFRPSFFIKAGDLNIDFRYKMDTDIFERSSEVSFCKVDQTWSSFRFHGENVSFKDKNKSVIDISDQEKESIIIKDRLFSFSSALPIKLRSKIYKLLWLVFRLIYVGLKSLSK
jgi:glycosyltransferase involved in cell wall biosynthesis